MPEINPAARKTVNFLGAVEALKKGTAPAKLAAIAEASAGRATPIAAAPASSGVASLIRALVATPAIQEAAAGASPAVQELAGRSAYAPTARTIPSGVSGSEISKFMTGQATPEKIQAAYESMSTRSRGGNAAQNRIIDMINAIKTELHPSRSRLYSSADISGAAGEERAPVVKAGIGRFVEPPNRPVATRQSIERRNNAIMNAAKENSRGVADSVVSMIGTHGLDGSIAKAIEAVNYEAQNLTGERKKDYKVKDRIEGMMKLVDTLHLVNGMVSGEIDTRATGIAKPKDVIAAKKIISGNNDLAMQYLTGRYPEAKVTEVMKGLAEALESKSPNAERDAYDMFRKAERQLETEGNRAIEAGKRISSKTNSGDYRKSVQEFAGDIAASTQGNVDVSRGARTSLGRREMREPNYVDPETGRLVIEDRGTRSFTGPGSEFVPEGEERVVQYGNEVRNRFTVPTQPEGEVQGLAGGLTSMRTLGRPDSTPEVIARGKRRLAEGRQIRLAQEREAAEIAAEKAKAIVREPETPHERMINTLVNSTRAELLGLQEGATPEERKKVLSEMPSVQERIAAGKNTKLGGILKDAVAEAIKKFGVKNINELNPSSRLSVYKEVIAGLRSFVEQTKPEGARRTSAERVAKSNIADINKLISGLETEIQGSRAEYAGLKKLVAAGKVPAGQGIQTPAILESGDVLGTPTGALEEFANIRSYGSSVADQKRLAESMLEGIRRQHGTEFVESVPENYRAPARKGSKKKKG